MKLSLQFINTNNNILLRAGKTVITLSDLIWQKAVSKSLPKTEIDMINLTMRSQEREGLVLSRQSCSSPRSSTFFFLLPSYFSCLHLRAQSYHLAKQEGWSMRKGDSAMGARN